MARLVDYSGALLTMVVVYTYDHMLAALLLFLILCSFITNSWIKLSLTILGLISVLFWIRFPCLCDQTYLTKFIYELLKYQVL